MSTINEKELFSRLKSEKTKRKAFEEMVNAFSRKLYWQIHYILQNHDDTDDVLQNTFLKAWKGIDAFNGDSALSTWLYRIAYNESITFLKQKHQSLSIDDEETTVDANFTADEYFDGDSTQKILQEAISTLPAKQKLVFCMKYFEDKKYKEISDIVGTSIGALKASYHMAVEKITKYVQTKEI